MSGELELFDTAGTPVPAGRAVLTPSADQWSVRVYDDGTPILEATLPDGTWLDVSAWCRLTEHTNPSKAVKDLVAPEHVRKLNTSTAYFPNHGYGNGRGNPVKLFVSREGANRLVLDSRVPGARRIKAWLADDVMPAIEDTGGYIAPGVGIALPDLSKGSPEVIEFVGRLGEAAAAASRTALIAMQQVQLLEAARAEDAPLVEQARHHRSTRALTAIGDFANDLQDWVRDEGINATVYHDDVRDYLGFLKLIIRGNTVRNNRPQSEAIKAGYVRPHNHDFGTSARLTRKGVGYVWDRITPHIKATGSAKPPAKSDGDAA